MNSRRRVQYYGFEANGVEVQLHVDVRMRQKAGTQTTKIKSAKSFVMVHPRKFIPSKYTRYTVSKKNHETTEKTLESEIRTALSKKTTPRTLT